MKRHDIWPKVNVMRKETLRVRSEHGLRRCEVASGCCRNLSARFHPGASIERYRLKAKRNSSKGQRETYAEKLAKLSNERDNLVDVVTSGDFKTHSSIIARLKAVEAELPR